MENHFKCYPQNLGLGKFILIGEHTQEEKH